MLAFDEVIDSVAITKERRGVAYNMPTAHYHDHYEIYYLKKGNVRYFINEQIYDINEGDVILIPPHVIHRTATLMNKGAERLLIAFTNKFIAYPGNDEIFSCFDTCYFPKSQVGGIIEKAAGEYFNMDSYSKDLIAGYIREIMVKLNRSTSNKPKEDISQNNSIMQKAVHYICENYEKELSLSLLAKKFALSESHFSRQFKVYTGFGLNEYIATVRVKNAEKLLVTTRQPVTYIAQKCGFNSSSYFAAVFKKVRGVSPGAVRGRKKDR